MSGRERAIQSIREKLHFARIRPETLVHLCEKEDKNNDELLNIHDLEDVLRDTLGKQSMPDELHLTSNFIPGKSLTLTCLYSLL